MRFILPLLLVGVMASGAQAQSFTLTDLGAFRPVALSDQGDMVGIIPLAFEQQAYLRQADGTIVPLGFLPIHSGPGCETCIYNSTPYDIAAGYAVGTSNAGLNGSQTHAFIWTPWGGMVDLGTRGDPNLFSAASAVNVFGIAAGYAQRVDGSLGAVTWSAGVLTDLPALPGWGWTFANAMNDSGMVAGEAFTPTGVHAVRWAGDGTVEDLNTLPDSGGFARAITSLGGVAGEAWLPGNLRRGFFWTHDTGMVVLETLPGDNASTARGYNMQSMLVGESIFLPPDCCAVVAEAVLWFWSTAPVRLADVTLGATDWILDSAVAVNDAGQIIGTGIFQNGRHGYRLDPVVVSAAAAPAVAQAQGHRVRAAR